VSSPGESSVSSLGTGNDWERRASVSRMLTG
jgi:hypothetical protein